jgi:hypothetical protein
METNFFNQLSAIRARQGERDEWMLSQILIPVSKNLKDSFFRWVDGELSDLRQKIELLDTIASATAKERVSQFGKELLTIEKETLPNALKNLQNLIDYIEKETEKTPKEVIEQFSNNIKLAIEISSHLISIRLTLDSMADMIPQATIELE